jgi:3-oxoacyl-[acyl-carrier-protein] synthase III
VSSLDTFVPGLMTTEQAVESDWYDADVRKASGLEAVAVSDSLSAPEAAVLAAKEAIQRPGTRPRISAH